MICSAAELGLGEDHDGIIVLPADAGEPGDDAFDVLGLREEVIEFEINPDRAYALSLRGVAREAATAFGVGVHRPGDCARCRLRTPTATRWSSRTPTGCPVFVARVVSGIDPDAATPDWMAQRLTLCGMRPISLTVDITNYVMLELGRPIHGYDADKLQGAIRVRRASEGERLTTLDGADRALSTEDLVVTDDSGIIGLGGVMGGETTEMSETTTRVLVEAAHWDAVSMFRTGRRHKLTSEAGKRNERGVDPVITRRRGRPRGRAAGAVRRRHRRARRDRRRRASLSRADPDGHLAAGADHRHGDPGRHGGGPPRGGRLSVGDGEFTPPTVAPRPDRPLRPGRGGRPVGRLRPGAVGPADATVGSRTHPGAEAAAPRRAEPGRRRLRRGGELPVHRRVRARPARTATRRRAPIRAAPGQPAVRGGAVDDHDAAAGAAEGPGPQRGSWCDQCGAVRVRDGDPAARRRSRTRSTASTNGPARARSTTSTRRFRTSRCTWRWWRPASASSPAGGVGGRATTWADAVDAVRVVAEAVGPRGDGAFDRPRAVAPGSLRGGVGRRRGDRPCRRAAPEGLRGLRRAGADRGRRARPRPAARAGAGRDRAPSYSDFPLAKEDVALVVDDAVAAGDVEAALRDGAGDLLESIRLFDVFTGEQVGAGKKSLGVRPAVPRSGPDPHRGRDGRRPRRRSGRRGRSAPEPSSA